MRMRSTKLAKTAQNYGRDVGRPSSCNAFAIATFSSFNREQDAVNNQHAVRRLIAQCRYKNTDRAHAPFCACSELTPEYRGTK